MHSVISGLYLQKLFTTVLLPTCITGYHQLKPGDRIDKNTPAKQKKYNDALAIQRVMWPEVVQIHQILDSGSEQSMRFMFIILRDCLTKFPVQQLNSESETSDWMLLQTPNDYIANPSTDLTNVNALQYFCSQPKGWSDFWKHYNRTSGGIPIYATKPFLKSRSLAFCILSERSCLVVCVFFTYLNLSLSSSPILSCRSVFTHP